MLVGDRQVRARVDSGADISILSSEVYDRLKRKPGKVKDINMQLADKNSILKGFVTAYPCTAGKTVFQGRDMRCTNQR
ncbi:hypothetical protein DPMN_106032 [Dreissena polymorpha]|uniref:Peptidase A2 domain-containing protein n=1 Tax=Dreissena polymorpha TaxID=45954 RepID=A0A9D4QI14_DREPO|nr:hypothetical protein DPMN_106032 [Dreissena polymorpha]